ncbi:MAG: ATP-binding cassette domain-containing protein [Candidatus Eremiobacteraeota bacterium]|nr:ATP-binding cassette domain-containing protein [Candidatus Eremiobacteraeota bacterium]
MTPRPSLELHAIVKRFGGGAAAVDAVDLTVLPGEIHALCGENGAGKSTLARIAAGKLAATSGEIVAAGTVGLVNQHFELARRLRVWENVVLGREPRRGARLDVAAARDGVRTLGAAYGLAVDPDAVVETLPVAIAQRVEILRELARMPAVLVLDEPTAVLGPVETEALFGTLRALAARGAAILLITHSIDDVLRYAQRVTVMRAGRVVLRADVSRTTAAQLAEAMVGGTLTTLAKRRATVLKPAFSARSVSVKQGAEAINEATFEVSGGEIVGLAGVAGNGQSALCDALAGVAPYAGEMSLRGRPLPPENPRARSAAGLRVVPGDGQREALVLPWSIVDNVALGDHDRAPLRRGFALDRRATATLARDIVERFDVRTRSIDSPVATLSGGNQQKLIVGRALAHAPAFVVAYQPTRGIDVGAAALVRSRLIEARNAGTAVLLIGFDLDEVLALSDRVLVMYRGTLVGEFAREVFDRGRIGSLMAGVA